MFIDIDKWQEIFLILNQHKLRTALTAFGVFWGIFMLVVLLGAGKGLENGVSSQFGGTANVVYMWRSGVTQFAYKGFRKGRWVPLTLGDIEALRREIPEAEVILGLNEVGGWRKAQYVVYGNKADSYITRGTHQEIARMSGYEVSKGRYINKLDHEERRKVAIIGQRVYEYLFTSGEDPIGKSIQIGGISFLVVGVFAPESVGSGSERDSELVLIPNSTLRYTFNQVRDIGSIRMIPKPGIRSEFIEQKAIKILRERTNVHPDDHGVWRSYNTQVDYDKVQSLFTGIKWFSWLVAIGTIFAGVIGVGNIMLIVVKERTREIGVRKAMGATARSIVAMIVQESLLITIVAGYFGLVCGVAALEGLNALLEMSGEGKNDTFSNPEVDFFTALSALVVLIAAGLLASLLPASKAAKVDPIVALQDE